MISLVESSFGYDSAHSITIDFAPLFSKKARAQNLLFFNTENKLIGHIGVIKRKISHKNHEYPVILIGGVCVAIEFRGEGYLKEMMSQTLSVFEDDYTLAFLWSSMTKMYEKFGFYEAGIVHQTGNRVLKTPPRGFQHVQPSKCPREFWEWIKEEYNNRDQSEAYIKRDEDDWEIIKEMDSVSLYINSESHQYFMINKGVDLPGIIHELSPCSKLLKELCDHPVWVSAANFNLSDYVQSFYLSFMKLGNPQMLSRFVENYSNQTIKIVDHQSRFLTLEMNGELQKKDHKEFLRALFGPGASLCEKQGHIPLIIGGVDSV